MKYNTLKIIIVAAAISLLGILITQSIWLKRTFEVAEKQFDHRADRMLTDVVDELKIYADTTKNVEEFAKAPEKCIFDVLDTLLLNELIEKYTLYHMLDSSYAYGVVTSKDNRILYEKHGFMPEHEEMAYKACLSCIWHEEYIHVSIYFRNKEKSILGKQMVWLILSVVFLLIIMSILASVIVGIIKQKKITEIKNDFVNNMTHELKTPLSTISVAAEVLMKSDKEKQGSPRINNYAKVIFDENQRMRKLVDKVLEVATLERNNVSIEKEEIDINASICKMIESFCFDACGKNVDIDYRLDAKNPIILADKLHFGNILVNLVDNAVKYSNGNPQIMVETKNQNDHCMISISDNGRGIPREAIHKVFDKFYRVPSGYVHDVKGFGLGLFYVKSMVDAHNGTIEINSAINKGTTVSVYFPQ